MSDDRGESGVNGSDDNKIKSLTSTMGWKCDKLRKVTGLKYCLVLELLMS